MATKTHNLSVKAGTYVGSDGQQKNKWVHIGAMMDGPYGSFILLDRHINLAGFPGDEPLMVNIFPVDNPQRNEPGLQYGKHHQIDDEIPF